MVQVVQYERERSLRIELEKTLKRHSVTLASLDAEVRSAEIV